MLKCGKGAKSVLKYHTDLRGANNKITSSMKDCDAVVVGNYGEGRVCLISCHPENKVSGDKGNNLVV